MTSREWMKAVEERRAEWNPELQDRFTTAYKACEEIGWDLSEKVLKKIYSRETGLLQEDYQEEAQHLMGHFLQQMMYSEKQFHPVEFAAFCYKRIRDIRPFKEGNEIFAKAVLDHVLVKKGFPPAVFLESEREELEEALVKARITPFPEMEPLLCIIAKSVMHAMEEK